MNMNARLAAIQSSLFLKFRYPAVFHRRRTATVEAMCNMLHLKLSPLPSSNHPDLGTALQNLSIILLENTITMLVANFRKPVEFNKHKESEI